MSRTSNISIRIEPEIKEQAEQVLSQLGIPMSNAVGIFLRQVILHQGIPFDLKLSQNKPIHLGEINQEQFNTEIEKAISDLTNKKISSADKVAERMNQDYGI